MDGPIAGGEDEEKTLEEWDAALGTGNLAASGGTDISGASGDRGSNEIGHGGGSYLVGAVDGTDGKVTITVTGPDGNKDDGKVQITGSQKPIAQPSDHNVVRPNGGESENVQTDIAVEDGTELTFGNGSSYGGKLNGDIVNAKGEDQNGEGSVDGNVGFINGEWEVGNIDLGNGDLTISDAFDQGSGHTYVTADEVNAGTINMTQGDTKLTSDKVNSGIINLGGNASLESSGNG